MCALKAAKNIGTTQIYVDFDECLDKVFRKNKTNPDETYFQFEKKKSWQLAKQL